MRGAHSVVLIALACGLAVMVSAAHPIPVSHAQAELSAGCRVLNSPFFDGYKNGGGSATYDFYAGETVTFTAGPPVLNTPDTITLRWKGTVIQTIPFPGTLRYTFPTNTTGSWQWISNFTVTWEVACGVLPEPPAEEQPAAPAAQPGPDVLLPIPATAAMGTFLANAPAFWAPGAITVPLVTLPPGQTAWVLGVDASRTYYKIAWSGQYLWVPMDTMEPAYDALWQGWPLPEIEVE